jgi:hypothetical protein
MDWKTLLAYITGKVFQSCGSHVKYLDTIFRIKLSHIWYPRDYSEQLAMLTKHKSEREYSR